MQRNHIESWRPDIVNKQEKNFLIVDIAISMDIGIHEKEVERVENYQKFKRKIKGL